MKLILSHKRFETVKMKLKEQLKHQDALSLQNLVCFATDQIKVIELIPITQGLSHISYKVIVKSQAGQLTAYFAKKIADRSTSSMQILMAKKCAALKYSPEVFFYNDQWLITQFIDGLMLSEITLGHQAQYELALEQMVKFHRLALTQREQEVIIPLNPIHIFTQLINAAHLTSKQIQVFNQLFALINENSELTHPSTSVLCHGDFNFKNVLIAEKNYLIDFETVYLAAPEYDIAMMMAVNNIPLSQLANICKKYNIYSNNKQLTCIRVVMRYLILSLIFNGLWYFSCIKEETSSDVDFSLLAYQQFEYLDIVATEFPQWGKQKLSVMNQMRQGA